MMVYRSPLHSLTLQVQPSGGPKRSQPNQTVPEYTPRILTASLYASLLLSFLYWNSAVAIEPESRHREPLVRVASCLKTHPRPPPPPKRLHLPRRSRMHKLSPHLRPPPSSASSEALFLSRTPPRRGTTRPPRSRTRVRRSFGLPMRMPLPNRYVPGLCEQI